MALTRTERFILNTYRSYFEHPPTFMHFLKLGSKKILTMAASAGFLGTLFYSYGYRESGCLLFGIGIGAIARQLGQIRVAPVAAGLLARIIDRERIEDLLQQEHSS